jgi:thiol-disulfide isomerase/thioredoxin
VLGGLEAVEHALAERAGTPLLLNFWATWCAPCVAELPDLLATAEAHSADGLEVLGVSFDLMIPGVTAQEAVGKVRAFLAERELALDTVVYDDEDYVAVDTRFELPGGIPVTLALDRTGAIVDRHVGEADAERFEELARAALGR